MDIQRYQIQAWKTAVFPEENGLEYLSLGLNGEAGEVAEVVKRVLRADGDLDETALRKEVGDVLWYIAGICSQMDWDLDQIAAENLGKLKGRQDKGKLRGKDRDE